MATKLDGVLKVSVPSASSRIRFTSGTMLTEVERQGQALIPFFPLTCCIDVSCVRFVSNYMTSLLFTDASTLLLVIAVTTIFSLLPSTNADLSPSQVDGIGRGER
jgi:hypothetical protein